MNLLSNKSSLSRSGEESFETRVSQIELLSPSDMVDGAGGWWLVALTVDSAPNQLWFIQKLNKTINYTDNFLLRLFLPALFAKTKANTHSYIYAPTQVKPFGTTGEQQHSLEQHLAHLKRQTVNCCRHYGCLSNLICNMLRAVRGQALKANATTTLTAKPVAAAATIISQQFQCFYFEWSKQSQCKDHQQQATATTATVIPIRICIVCLECYYHRQHDRWKVVCNTVLVIFVVLFLALFCFFFFVATVSYIIYLMPPRSQHLLNFVKWHFIANNGNNSQPASSPNKNQHANRSLEAPTTKTTKNK